MNLVTTILALCVFFLRVFVVIKVGVLLVTYLFNDNIEISRTFYLLMGYMIFELYLFKSFDNSENVDIYKEKK